MYLFSKNNDAVLCHAEALDFVGSLADESVDLVLTDPPWNTGKRQHLSDAHYPDSFRDLAGHLEPVFKDLLRVLKPTGALLVHMSVLEAHRVKAMVERVFGGPDSFRGELVVQHEAGRGGNDNVWAIKHSYVSVFSKGASWTFNADKIPLTDRKAPKPGYPATKPCNSVLPATMSTTDPSRLPYPSQKPEWLYRTFVEVYSNPGDVVLDPFCGSGTTGAAAVSCGRTALLCDRNKQAIDVTAFRLKLAAR